MDLGCAEKGYRGDPGGGDGQGADATVQVASVGLGLEKEQQDENIVAEFENTFR